MLSSVRSRTSETPPRGRPDSVSKGVSIVWSFDLTERHGRTCLIPGSSAHKHLTRDTSAPCTYHSQTAYRSESDTDSTLGAGVESNGEYRRFTPNLSSWPDACRLRPTSEQSTWYGCWHPEQACMVCATVSRRFVLLGRVRRTAESANFQAWPDRCPICRNPRACMPGPTDIPGEQLMRLDQSEGRRVRKRREDAARPPEQRRYGVFR